MIELHVVPGDVVQFSLRIWSLPGKASRKESWRLGKEEGEERRERKKRMEGWRKRKEEVGKEDREEGVEEGRKE